MKSLTCAYSADFGELYSWNSYSFSHSFPSVHFTLSMSSNSIALAKDTRLQLDPHMLTEKSLLYDFVENSLKVIFSPLHLSLPSYLVTWNISSVKMFKYYERDENYLQENAVKWRKNVCNQKKMKYVGIRKGQLQHDLGHRLTLPH